MHHEALRPDDQRVSQFGKLKLPSLRAKVDVATGASEQLPAQPDLPFPPASV